MAFLPPAADQRLPPRRPPSFPPCRRSAATTTPPPLLSPLPQISGNHRVSDAPEDVERVKRAGGSIAQSDIDGVIAGPLRVWPGGLMMTRSLGDASAGDVSVRVCGRAV